MSRKIDLARLNPRQREAVLHGDGPLLILAGAGSGKTSTMAYRIAHLIAMRKTPPTAILGLSFTNKAASELKKRVGGLVTDAMGPRSAKGLLITTFHSLCARLLRVHAEVLGFQANFTIVDQNDQKDILKEIFRNIRIDDRKFDLDTILFEIGQAKNKLMSKDKAEAYFLENKRLSPEYAIATASSFAKYQEKLKLLNSMDFDDLLYYGVELLDRHPEVRAQYNQRFQYVLVDEYQDTNPTQFKLLRCLTQTQQNICVVGDDDQSIYSWRGADAAHILGFSGDYPSAKTITLDQNYRSTSTILEAANAVIVNNRQRHPKTLWSDRGSGAPITEVILEEDRAEGEFVAKEIFTRAQEHHRPWKDFAVLYRSNSQSRIFEETLRRHQIPYKMVGGLSFLDRKEVKDALSYWRLVVNTRDDASLRRILNWPARGIGKSSIEACGENAFKKNISFFESLSDASRIAPKSAGAAHAFRALIEGMRQELESLPWSPEALSQWGRRSLEKIGAKRAIEAENLDDPAQFVRKWENVEELVHSMGQLRPEDIEGDSVTCLEALREYLSRMALDAKNEEEDRNRSKEDEAKKDQVTLLTLHGAKGLEYPVVFMVGCEDGYLPHKRTIEGAEDLSEERRLCYVGITRARDHLLLTRARTRIRYGKPVPRYRSRFMNEIPIGTLLTRDESHGPDKTDDAEVHKAHEEKVKSYLSGIRAMLDQKKPN